MFQVVSSQCIFGTQGEESPSLLLEEMKPLVSWSEGESHSLTLNLYLELWRDLSEGCFVYNLPRPPVALWVQFQAVLQR